MPGAVWIGPTPNRYPGGMSTVVGVVLHVQQGTETGTEAWQRNPRSQVSSHFLLPKTGGVRQMVDTEDAAWCEVDGNRHWISIECEGWSGQVLTAAQLDAAARILLWVHRTHGVPLAITNDWKATRPAGLGYHAMGGNAWGGHFNCPGTPIINQRALIVARAQHLDLEVPDLNADEHKDLVACTKRIEALIRMQAQIQTSWSTVNPNGTEDIGPVVALQQLEVRLQELEQRVAELAAELDMIMQTLSQILDKLPAPPPAQG